MHEQTDPHDESRHLSSADGTLDANQIGWVRQCAVPVDLGEGEVVAVEGIPPKELGRVALEFCGAIDMSRVFTDDEAAADDPPEWRCSSCGGRFFEYVAVYFVIKIISASEVEQP
jgi:hypothetical protein